jgi:hypothetical protein
MIVDGLARQRCSFGLVAGAVDEVAHVATGMVVLGGQIPRRRGFA